MTRLANVTFVSKSGENGVAHRSPDQCAHPQSCRKFTWDWLNEGFEFLARRRESLY